MQTGAGELDQQTPELVPLNVIRVETALSRYPVHRLAKQGTVSIEIREKSPDGVVLVHWEVSHNSRYGQPGPLAYKIDTLIVNRRIEEASRPIPQIIKLGSIHDICRELGLRGGKPRENVKNALYQNAFTGIKAKFRYKLADGKGKELEAGFTRYSVVFTGEDLPDGRRADAVYLVLNEIFMKVINGAQTRPLDYDYLKDLPPASQRLYELLSFQIYAALKYGRKEAKLGYAEFCTHAPLTQFLKWDQVRPQMARIHRPHLKSGYIESVKFEQTANRDGKPDWLMVYVPGFKARAEYRAFTKRGGPRVLEIEQAPPTVASPAKPEPTALEEELISRGVTPSTAAELVAEYPEGQVAAQVEHFDWLKTKHPKKVKENPGGFLASAIRDDYARPKGFVTKAERAKRDEQVRAREAKQKQAEETQRKQEAATVEAENQAFSDFWEALPEGEQEAFKADALKRPTDFWVLKYRQMPDRSTPSATSLLKAILKQHFFNTQQGEAPSR
jgi:hypothetical protein